MSKFSAAYKIIRQIQNWPLFFLDYFGFIRNGRLKYIFRDGKILYARAHTTDRGIIHAVVVQDEYRIHEKESLDVVIDLGGNIGSFSVLAAQKAKRIIMVEPIRANLEIARKSIRANGLDQKISVIPAAINSTGKPVRIYLHPNNTGGHSSVVPSDSFEKCDGITLAKIFEQYHIDTCDLLKIDIEGGEYDVLYNLPDALWKRIKSICLEWHDLDAMNHNHTSLIHYLEKKQFVIKTNSPILFADRMERNVNLI